MRISMVVLILAAATATGSAQGIVTFQNSVVFQTPDPTGGNRLVYDVGSPLDPVTGVGLTGTNYVAELYAGSDVSSLMPVTASTSRFRSTTTAGKGKWGGSTIYGTSNLGTVLPGFGPYDVVT